ncbi:MAG: DUF2141 domain-containing protein [Bacteroidota bacterium]
MAHSSKPNNKMLKYIFALLILSAVLISPAVSLVSGTSSNANIRVVVKGIKPVKGNVGLLIFNSKQGFPSDERKALKQSIIPVTGSTMEYVFEGLVPGKYAVAIIHDENANRKLDTNFMGIPREGYGVSNNIVNMFGPPGFDESSFTLKPGTLTTEINVHY